MGVCGIIAQAFWSAFFGWTMPIIIGVSIFLIIKGVKTLAKVKKAVCDVCGKVFENARAESSVRLHKQKAHGVGNCSHPNKRYLNPSVQAEANAITHGYAMYCPDCDEVIK